MRCSALLLTGDCLQPSPGPATWRRNLCQSVDSLAHARRDSSLLPVTSYAVSVEPRTSQTLRLLLEAVNLHHFSGGRSSLLRPFSSHTPPASRHDTPKPVYGPAILVFDCLLRLRHLALLGDRRQRFFFADLGSAQGPVRLPPTPCMLAQACAGIRLYLLETFWVGQGS